MTHQAFNEIDDCKSFRFSYSAKTQIIKANLNEDNNVIRKWFHSAHFYNPKKDVFMWRLNSKKRVKEILNNLDELFSEYNDSHVSMRDEILLDIYTETGYLIHHIQDMIVPAHVVPIMHRNSDKFENYEVEDYTTSSGSLCDFIGDTNTPAILHHYVALKTIKGTNKSLNVRINNAPRVISWRAFWQESPDNTFGRYGFLGNNFAKTQINLNGDIYEISPDVYYGFKKHQIRLGVEGTKRVFNWLIKKLESNDR